MIFKKWNDLLSLFVISIIYSISFLYFYTAIHTFFFLLTDAPTGDPDILLQTSCPDCIVVKSNDLIDTLLLLSKKSRWTESTHVWWMIFSLKPHKIPWNNFTHKWQIEGGTCNSSDVRICWCCYALRSISLPWVGSPQMERSLYITEDCCQWPYLSLDERIECALSMDDSAPPTGHWGSINMKPI